MKKSVAIVGWVLCAVLLVGAAGCGSILAAVLFVVAAVLVCPIFRARVKLPGKVWIPAVVVLFLIGCFLMPQPDRPEGQQEAGSPSSQGEQDEGPGATAPSDEGSEPSAPVEPVPPVEDNPAPPEPSEDQVVGESMEGISVTFSDSVRNDVTGNWRLALISDGLDMEDYAVSYYQSFFESDSEVHFVVDFTRGTTTKISYVSGSLSVVVYEYVDGEEHDAKLLPSGEKLASFLVDVSTGEIEKVG